MNIVLRYENDALMAPSDSLGMDMSTTSVDFLIDTSILHYQTE